jgi:hypothetical protein
VDADRLARLSFKGCDFVAEVSAIRFDWCQSTDCNVFDTMYFGVLLMKVANGSIVDWGQNTDQSVVVAKYVMVDENLPHDRRNYQVLVSIMRQ